MELILVQHAESELSAAGRRQALAVARRLGAEGGWDALYAAGPPAADTAAAIATATGLTPAASPATAASVDAVIADHPGQRVLVCTSPEVIDEVVCRAFAVTAQVVRSPDPTGITRIMASRAGHREIVALNETAHLRGADPHRDSLHHNKPGKG